MQIELKRIQQEVGNHLHLRHARPGRGADDERPHRRLQPRPHRPDRHVRSRSTSIPRPRSSPGSSASRMFSSARRRFTVRPEKIRMLAARGEARCGRRDGTRRRAGGGLHRLGHAVHRRPRLRAARLTVVRQNVESFAGDSTERARSPRRASPGGRSTCTSSNRRKGRETNEEGSTETRGARGHRGGGRRARVCGLRLRRGRLELVRDWQVAGLGSSLDEIQQKAKDEGQVNLVEWAGYSDKSWATSSRRRRAARSGRRTARRRTR